ncbi:MAG: WXG100 family type VII secretion target [Lachnospiraceae bacterium]|nr:WXG100 family type VII secretion target [Lachnospiraceae bacterium]
MGADLIQVSPELLRGKASQVLGYKTEHDTAIKSLDTLIHSLDEIFKGDAQKSVVTEFDNMKALFEKFSNLLQTYADALNMDADELEAKDAELAGKNAQKIQSVGF